MQWVAFFLMTAVAMVAVAWPLIRPARLRQTRGDVAIYRDQLREVDRDLALGLIAPGEAQAARTELSRLLLAADAAPADAAPADAGTRARGGRGVVIAALVLLPLIAAGLYLRTGSPRLSGQPFAEREDLAAERALGERLAQVETYLSTHPQDVRGWELLGPIYLRMGRADDAVRALRNALTRGGETAAREADLGEALVVAAGGTVSPDAAAAFARASAMEPGHIKARFYLGLAAEQAGRPSEAAAIWRALLEGAGAAPWAAGVREALARVEGTAPAASAPLPEDRGAGRADDEDAAVRAMVERLAARLATKGGEAEEWAQLVRSYMVLGEQDKARAVLRLAQEALADQSARSRFEALIANLPLQR